jgi:hypothetical protein
LGAAPRGVVGGMSIGDYRPASYVSSAQMENRVMSHRPKRSSRPAQAPEPNQAQGSDFCGSAEELASYSGGGSASSQRAPADAEAWQELDKLLARVEAGIAEEKKAMDALLAQLRTTRIAA